MTVLYSLLSSMTSMSSSSSAKFGSDMLTLALQLPLRNTENPENSLITEIFESIFDMRNRLRVHIGLLPLVQPGTTLQLDAGFIDGSSLKQVTINTAEIEDAENKNMMTCENNGISNPSQ